MRRLDTLHGPLELPVFMPDATRGVVRALDAEGLETAGVGCVMVNALHLGSRPGASVIENAGGIHRFMGWNGPVASDSGGYQIYSLLANNPKAGAVTAAGFTYRAAKGGRKERLTPEQCIKRQFRLGADILFCLDYCTHPDADASTQRESVERTVDWARQCKEAFVRRVGEDGTSARPLLFAVIQGGADVGLRRACAEQLLEIGFDGYGYGGWPIDREGRLLDMVAHVAGLVPEDLPKHGLGIGKPENLVRAARAGYDLFDCVIPTRDARRKRLYAFNGDPDTISLDDKSFYRHVYLQDEEHARANGPIDDICDAPCCRRYSRAYLHHLFRADEGLAHRLATIHNLRFYTRLIERLRRERNAAS